MKPINLAHLDLNLLVTFEVLMSEGSVTRAAEWLSRTQSAVSHSLARLREQLGDPLLVKVGGTMVPSPYAQTLVDEVRPILRSIQRIAALPQHFEPATSERVFRVEVSDFTPSVLPEVMARVREQAPSVAVEWSTPGSHTPMALADGLIDIAMLSSATNVPEGVVRQDAGALRLRTYLRKEHPAIASWGLAEWVRWPHVQVMLGDRQRTTVDMAISEGRIRRTIGARVPHFSCVPELFMAKFIAQVMSGDKGLRSIEDVELATLSYAEVKALASGNPKVIEKAGVDADIARYSSLFMVWRNQRYANESEVAHLPMRIESSMKLLSALTSDADAAASLLHAGDLVATVHGRLHRGPESLGDALRTVIRMARARVSARSTEELLGEVGSFELWVFIGREFDDVHLYLKGEAIHDCRSCQTGPALYQALRDTILAMPDRRAETERKLASIKRRLDELREELGKPFDHEERLTALLWRQRALAAELDLDKDEASTQGLEASEESMAA